MESQKAIKEKQEARLKTEGNKRKPAKIQREKKNSQQHMQEEKERKGEVTVKGNRYPKPTKGNEENVCGNQTNKGYHPKEIGYKDKNGNIIGNQHGQLERLVEFYQEQLGK